MTKEDIILLIKEHIYSSDADTMISDDMGLFKDLKFDSLKFIEFIAELEQRLGWEFDDMSGLFERLDNIGELCDFILQTVVE